MQVIRKQTIGTESAPGDLILCEAWGQHYVAYQAPSGSNFRRTRYLDEQGANDAFDHIVETRNWNGVVHQYA